MNTPLNLYEVGHVVENCATRNGFVYVKDVNGFDVCVGELSVKNYSWTQDVLVPNYDSVNLIVLSNDGVVEFGFKQLFSKEDAIKQWWDRLSDDEKSKVFDQHLIRKGFFKMS